MQHSLIFLGKGNFSDLWKASERYESPGCLRGDMSSDAFQGRLCEFLSTMPRHFRDKAERYSEIVSSLLIGYLSYDAFANVMKNELPLCGTSVGCEVYRNLIEGLLCELHRRGLLVASDEFFSEKACLKRPSMGLGE